MHREPLAALRVLAVLTLVTGVVYPLAMTGVSQLLFPAEANGSLIWKDGRLTGSRLIGQPFAGPRYFWGRPSATATAPYNTASSGGSNLGPLSTELKRQVEARIRALREADPDNRQPIPPDLLTASGSGLDPHISPEAAEYQAPRVARERRLKLDRVRELIRENTQGRQLGVLGEPAVNVLGLNQALDALPHAW